MFQLAKKDLTARLEAIKAGRVRKPVAVAAEVEVGNPYRCTCQPAPSKQTCQVHALARILPQGMH